MQPQPKPDCWSSSFSSQFCDIAMCWSAWKTAWWSDISTITATWSWTALATLHEHSSDGSQFDWEQVIYPGWTIQHGIYALDNLANFTRVSLTMATQWLGKCGSPWWSQKAHLGRMHWPTMYHLPFLFQYSTTDSSHVAQNRVIRKTLVSLLKHMSSFLFKQVCYPKWVERFDYPSEATFVQWSIPTEPCVNWFLWPYILGNSWKQEGQVHRFCMSWGGSCSLNGASSWSGAFFDSQNTNFSSLMTFFTDDWDLASLYLH